MPPDFSYLIFLSPQVFEMSAWQDLSSSYLMVAWTNTSTAKEVLDINPLNNLYPAIVQCFVVITSGYIAGHTGIISPSQADGVGSYVTKFALPALLFRNMCILKFSTINWYLLSSFLLAKTVLFIIVAVFTVILSGQNKLGRAGLFAIFTTQSNDFALGYPIGVYIFS